MRYGVGNPLLVGHRGVDIERHCRVGPAELLAGNADRFQHWSASFGFGTLQVRHGAQHDVTLEDREAADIGVAHWLVAECRRGDEGGAGDRSRSLFALVNVSPAWRS